ncbi:MAG: hypothetical protein AAFQ98_09560 [Bacteroidota bacterium]
MTKKNLFESATALTALEMSAIAGGSSNHHDQGDSNHHDQGDSNHHDQGDSNHHDVGDSNRADVGMM